MLLLNPPMKMHRQLPVLCNPQGTTIAVNRSLLPHLRSKRAARYCERTLHRGCVLGVDSGDSRFPPLSLILE